MTESAARSRARSDRALRPMTSATTSSHSEDASMTAETIHTCSYSCERPECIRAQRDELAARLTAETSNARGETYTFDMIEDAWGDAVPLTKPYFNRFRARLETLRQSAAPQPAAEAHPVAKLVNRKDADGGKTTTFIRPTSLGMDLPLGEYPLHLHPPPSAPVGVEDVEVLKR